MSTPLRAWAVVDLGFGDAGKGLLTDSFVRRNKAELVVRFNGGPQAGHNVLCSDGRHHTFSQFGSGSFVRGVKTILSRYVVIHPTALLLEGRILKEKGLSDIFSRILISEGAMLITPYHQAVGRLRELSRGRQRHGSCGVGFGEVVGRSLSSRDHVLHAGDLFDRASLRRKLLDVKDRMWSEVQMLPEENLGSREALREISCFERPKLLESWLEEAIRLVELDVVASESALSLQMRDARSIVFEGAQGILLDERAGFHPYTTWSRCTFENAEELLAEVSPGERIHRIGVTRALAVRHGPGPFPTEDCSLKAIVTADHNRPGPWQGEVRYGWFDAVLMRYALDVVGPLDIFAVTHLDVPGRASEWKLAGSYAVSSNDDVEDFFAEQTEKNVLSRLSTEQIPSLEAQSRLAHILSKVRPQYLSCEPAVEAVLQAIEKLLSRRVNLISTGPTAEDIAWRDA